MAATKPEETFHKYLRQHFEKVSQNRVRKFAEERRAPNVEIGPGVRSPDGSAGDPK